MNVKRINKFIKGELVKRIREGADAYRILNERDLESLVYHELRKKLDKYEDVKISTNFTVSYGSANRLSWKKKSKGAGKFIQPDVAILESRNKELKHKPKMHIAIELKAQAPTGSIYHDRGTYQTFFGSKTLQKDFKKLNKLKGDSIISTGYFLYLYFDINKKSRESKVKKILEASFPKSRFEIIMINKFENPKTKNLFSEYEAEIFSHRSKQLYKYYAGKNRYWVTKLWEKCPICDEVLPHSSESIQMKHKKKKKKKPGRKLKISKKKLSERAKKAWRTRKRDATKKKRKK